MAARVPALLFNLGYAAHCAKRGVAGMFRRHAFFAVDLNLMIEMVAQFVAELLVHLLAAKSISEMQRQRVQPLCQAHVHASLSLTMPEIAEEIRFQLAVSCSNCFRPSRVTE